MLFILPALYCSHRTIICQVTCLSTPFVLVTGAGKLQQRENRFAVSSQDHGEPHRSGLEPREYVRGYINNFSAANAYNPPPQEQ